jgi:hypothetical protein
MRKRFPVRTTVGLVACVATIALLSLPTSAGQVTLPLFGWTANLHNADSDAVVTVPLGDNVGTVCSAATHVITTSTGSTTSGTITVTMSSNRTLVFGTTTRNVAMTGSWSGTWTKTSATTSAVTSSGSITLVLRPATGCTLSTGVCTVTIGNISGVATLNSADPPNITTTDSLVFSSASNSLGDDIVTGTASNCGVFIAANDGHATLT